MNGSRFLLGPGAVLLLITLVWADDPATPQPPANPAATTPAPAATPAATNPNRGIRLHLMEGSVVTGKLSSQSLSVETEFGKLDIPVAHIVSFTPGLDSHPEERQRIGRLIQQLGSNVAADRDAAQRTLTDLGKSIQSELARFTQDEDTERRTRVQKILAELEDADDEDEADPSNGRPWPAQDSVETSLFTVVGKISPRAFEVQTQFGPLQVAISDIRRAERDTDQKPEFRKSLGVTGEHIVQNNLLNTGIRLNRGDKVQFTADGRLTMTPWGNNASSTPDGSEQFQWYIPNQIAGGSLVGRVGVSGKVFKIGSKHTFTASRGGVLYLAIAMNPQFSSQDYNFPGRYEVKVRVNPR
ncbi:MAG: hypothetical protein JSS02_02290 [Planctomycetes bacterium]|nr:hypothetical protein [Planctomycetota bacterium]